MSAPIEVVIPATAQPIDAHFSVLRGFWEAFLLPRSTIVFAILVNGSSRLNPPLGEVAADCRFVPLPVLGEGDLRAVRPGPLLG